MVGRVVWREAPVAAGGQKKTARTVNCPCREASDANYFQLRRGRIYRLLNWNIYTIA